MNHTAPVLPGETLEGKYRVERIIGEGGMGVVVSARHLQLDERVAIKFLVGEPSEASSERFLREARAAAKVKGEHVCRVFDFGCVETGEPYIVMELLEGTDLARKLKRDGPQPAALVVGWIIEACDALADAHALGIVHRDLKPANLFLANRPDGSACAKVLDFGISKLTKAETMTHTAATMGSPVYMSPEQMESSHEVDARSDLWSIGVMLYELLAGEPPFIGGSMIQLAVMIREKEPTPLAIAAPTVPEGLAEVVAKCLAKKPDDRYASVADLVAALAPFAPADVAALVTRLRKRGASLADTQAAPSAPRSAPVAASSEQASHLARAQATFAPLQSTLGARESVAPSRRWPFAVAGVALIAIAGFAVHATTSRGAVGAALEAAAPSAPASIAASADPTPSAAVAAATVSSLPLPMASASVALAPTARTASPPRMRTVTAVPVSVTTVGSSAATAAPPPPASASAAPPATRKGRTLDREDP